MILGLTPLTWFHVALSLVGVASGLVVLFGLLVGDRMNGWTLLFLATTAATTLTGFLLPFSGITPAVAVGIVSTVVLVIAFLARYAFGMAGAWRWIYIGSAVLAFYLNAFVLVVQSFQKMPSLNVFAPTGSEPPFVAAQASVLVAFIVVGLVSLRTFRPARA
jgi:hypothetical protein